MLLFGSILLSLLAALGVALGFLEFMRKSRAKNTAFICLCFKEELLDSVKPDVIIICRTDADQEEIIKRIGKQDERNIFFKYI